MNTKRKNQAGREEDPISRGADRLEHIFTKKAAIESLRAEKSARECDYASAYEAMVRRVVWLNAASIARNESSTRI